MKKEILIGLLASILVISPTKIVASGSGSTGFSNSSLSPNQKSLNNGRTEFRKSVICSKCKYPTGIKTVKEAQEVANKIKRNDIVVNKRNKKDVLYYISQVYGIKV